MLRLLRQPVENHATPQLHSSKQDDTEVTDIRIAVFINYQLPITDSPLPITNRFSM
jgi:hypothetical protein